MIAGAAANDHDCEAVMKVKGNNPDMIPCEKCKIMIPLAAADYLVAHLALHHDLSREEAQSQAVRLRDARSINGIVMDRSQ